MNTETGRTMADRANRGDFVPKHRGRGAAKLTARQKELLAEVAERRAMRERGEAYDFEENGIRYRWSPGPEASSE